MEWLDSNQIQTTDPVNIKQAMAYNQALRSAEADMLDVEHLLKVMADYKTLHVEEQSEDV